MKPFRDWPWSVKLGVLFVGLSIFPIAIVTAYTEYAARREFMNDRGIRNLQQATGTAALIGRFLDDVVGDVKVLAGSPAAVEVLGAGNAEMQPRLATLMQTMRDTKRLELLKVIDTRGTVVAATESDRVGQSRAETPFFKHAIAGDARVHEPRYLDDDGDVHIHASVPVVIQGRRIVGIAAARIRLTDIDRFVSADTNYGGFGEYGLLWDDRGIVLSAPSASDRRFRPLAPLAPDAVTQIVAEAHLGPRTAQYLAQPANAGELVEAGKRRFANATADPHVSVMLQGERVYATVAPVPGTRWTYGIVTPESAAIAGVRGQTARNLAVGIGTAMIALFLALCATRWVGRPLRRVADAARALAAGDMTRRAGLPQRDEIGQLADAFDAMADSLASKDAELRVYADSLERRVQERTTELTGLLAAIPDLIFKVSPDGRLSDYVPAKGHEIDIPATEFVGRPITDVRPHEVSEAAVERIMRALAGEEIPPYEYRLTIGGVDRHFEARISPSSQGSVVVLVRDITERRRTEERTRFLAAAAASLSSSLDYGSTVETLANLSVPMLADICVVDLVEHGQIRCAAVAATTPQQQAIVFTSRAKYPVPVDSDHPVALAARGGATLYADCTADTFRSLSRSPEQLSFIEALRPRSMIVVPLPARGQTLGSMSLVRTSGSRRYVPGDVTLATELADRAGVALDNARLYREVQESNRLKDEFLGTVSHELRTPLNAVLGWAQVLKTTGAQDQTQAARALDAIERNAQAQAQLVEDLLDTSRVVSGKLRVDFIPTDVGHLVQATVESFRPQARTRGITLALSIEGDLVPILADGARLQQVVGNLLSNALKFTPLGGRVDVTVRRSDATVEIVVADTGAGIAPEFLPFVFDRFRQGDSTTTRVHGGLGLGLSIARHLAELHGGTIRAESAGDGHGATFTIVLPARVGSVTPATPAGKAAPSIGGARVLVVDDQPDARTLMEAVLGAAGATVTTAASAEEARLRISASRPDVVLSDIGMPGEDGYALIRSIREADERAGRPRLPCVAVTAYARDDDRARALAAGYDRHLTKPIAPAELLRTIAELRSGA